MYIELKGFGALRGSVVNHVIGALHVVPTFQLYTTNRRSIDPWASVAILRSYLQFFSPGLAIWPLLYICAMEREIPQKGDEVDAFPTARHLSLVPPQAQTHENGIDYVVDAEKASGSHGKLAKDGHTLLIPQPSSDPKDPLNWSSFKKHLILLIVSWASLLADYGSATGAVTLIPQATEWGISPDTVNHSQVGNVFMLGAGGVFVVAGSAYFGRLPILFWFLVIATATAAWCAAATSFESFMAARILNGFFSTVSILFQSLM